MVIGFLKVGEKNLFYRDAFGNLTEMTPLCVLDFYVDSHVQRGGFGRVKSNNFLYLTFCRKSLRKCLK